MTNYKDMYTKNKSAYITIKNHFGGSFNVDEQHYINHHYDNLNGIDLLAGPISHTIIVNTKYNKKIHLFGDRHIYTNKFSCNNKATQTNSIYFPDYLEYYFGKEKEKILDLFIELPYQYDKTVPLMRAGMINNVYLRFKNCFEILTDKSTCKTKYSNIRFHAMDIRKYMSDMFIKESDISLFNYFCHIIDKLLQDTNKKYVDDVNRLDDMIQQLYQHEEFTHNEKFHEIAEAFYNKHDNLETVLSKLLLLIIDNVGDSEKNSDKEDTNKNRDKNTDKNSDIYTESYMKLYMFKQSIMITEHEQHPIIMDDFMKEMVKRFIGDENGVYNDMDDRFWYMIMRSPKIKSNVGEIVGNNFEPNITLRYKKDQKSDDNDIVKEMIKTNKITYDSLYLISRILWSYDVALMDVYMLGRIFKQFKQKTPDDIFSESADNIIIIAGNNHIKSYIDFFTKIDSKIIYQSPPFKESLSPDNRCVPFHELTF